MDKMYSQIVPSSLFTSGTKLVLMPLLAQKIGLNEAIILQQINYWMTNPLNENFKEGRMWVYNTYDQWMKQFPFWSYSTIKTTILSLQNKKLIISGSFNRVKTDRTKWYTIDYESVTSLGIGTSAEFKPMISLNQANGQLKSGSSTNPKITTKITTEIKENNKRNFDSEFNEFWSAYPKKVDKHKCSKIYQALLVAEGLGLHQAIVDALSGQLGERKANDELGEWNAPHKNPSTWLNGRCWENSFKTEGEVYAEHKRCVSRIANKQGKMSRVDQLHANNARVRDATAKRIEAIEREEEAIEREERRIANSLLSLEHD